MCNILYKIIDQEISSFHFPDKLNLAELSPLHKENDVMNKKYYKPISILPSISKLFERLVQDQIMAFIKAYLYMYICGYRKGYRNQHALITLIEKWNKSLGGRGYFGAIITDLSKAFDTINHELFLAKLHAYGFDSNSLMLITKIGGIKQK